MSDALIAPEAPTSNLTFVVLATNPDRTFTALTSFESTARLLFTSPRKKPSDAEAYTDAALSRSDTVTRELSGIPVKSTDTSVPSTEIVLAPIVEPCGSTTVTLAGVIAGPSNWKTILCPLPMARGSTVIAPLMDFVVSTLMSYVPTAA